MSFGALGLLPPWGVRLLPLGHWVVALVFVLWRLSFGALGLLLSLPFDGCGCHLPNGPLRLLLMVGVASCVLGLLLLLLFLFFLCFLIFSSSSSSSFFVFFFFFYICLLLLFLLLFFLLFLFPFLPLLRCLLFLFLSVFSGVLRASLAWCLAFPCAWLGRPT